MPSNKALTKESIRIRPFAVALKATSMTNVKEMIDFRTSSAAAVASAGTVAFMANASTMIPTRG